MRDFPKFKRTLGLMLMIALLAGCQVENTKELTDTVNHALSNSPNYNQTTQIEQQSQLDDRLEVSQQTNQIEVTNDKLTNGKIILKQNNAKNQILEMRQDTNGNTYIRENDADWTTTQQTNREIERVTLLTPHQISRLFNLIAETGMWERQASGTQLSYEGENTELLHLINSVATTQLNPGAHHQITIELDDSAHPLGKIHWVIEGENRTTQEAVTTTVEIQYTIPNT